VSVEDLGRNTDAPRVSLDKRIGRVTARHTAVKIKYCCDTDSSVYPLFEDYLQCVGVSNSILTWTIRLRCQQYMISRDKHKILLSLLESIKFEALQRMNYRAQFMGTKVHF
jgi:hypothetical protein